jgi:hypothetical protein
VDCFLTKWESFPLGLELKMKSVMGNKKWDEEEDKVMGRGHKILRNVRWSKSLTLGACCFAKLT